MVRYLNKGLLLVLSAASSTGCAAHGAPGTSASPLTGVAPAERSDASAASEKSPPAEPEPGSGWTNKPGWFAKEFMVATANPLATQAGYEMLQQGGSAIDAAIAAQMVLTLVEPQSSGIGGGAFLMYFDGKKKVDAYDGRETAPDSATDRLFYDENGETRDFQDVVATGLPVGVPGVLRMLEKAHEQHGKLAWKKLFQPAIKLAEVGFGISPRLASLIRSDKHLMRDEAARRYFYDDNLKPKVAGTILKNPELAQVLRDVAERGAEAFYTGSIAKDIVGKVANHPIPPGLLTTADLEHYKPIRRDPVCTVYRRRWKVCGMPPPSSGGIAIAQILGILERLPDEHQIGREKPIKNAVGWYEPTPKGAHLFAAASCLAYADRGQYIADPSFVPLPGEGGKNMVDATYLSTRAKEIDVSHAGKCEAGNPAGISAVFAKDESPELPSTSHISVVDRHGGALSMTTSVEDAFGSRQMVRGFFLNNHLTDFSFKSEDDKGRPVANRVQPGKRPRSAMSPTLVFEEGKEGAMKLVMSTGSPGGPPIINYVVKVLVGTLDWNLDVQSAIALPNFGSPTQSTVEVEQGRVSDVLIDALGEKKYKYRVVEKPLTSGLGGITRVVAEGQELWFGGADPRREGTVMGD